ncbi:xanthine dehydrogenase accessory factor [Novosphingobium chloroacetimidivorans]|uniref:Xanthine dehydrogenase accessory factor n=1 Tax=Novosphingobium chloroacetimidivorans TaxID=1428314 RepID=A0A7W7K8X3_9SPHN|nr:XdhC family protein [Novosphingobium chloroacetimidivorans]MBB4858417.1 xanthine dehydrogenase accessory factor [Novosphingobium chloroacetimidivorans]
MALADAPPYMSAMLHAPYPNEDDVLLADADWPTFGWSDDIRPALAQAMAAGRPAALATLFEVGGSAPRGPGAQMLFVGNAATGYFSGDCIEGDVAGHARQVLADGVPRRLHYGMGSPWIDIRLRCGGALHVMVERIEPGSPAAQALISHARARTVCIWQSDGREQRVLAGDGPLLDTNEDPLTIRRRHDPPRRLIVTGGDPGALALARLGNDAQFETILVRPLGPETPPPFPVAQYLREPVSEALERLGVDRWTAYVGATHEDEHDLGGCLAALRGGARYVAMIGARSRAPARLSALEAAGATPAELARLQLSPGVPGLGKAPWEVATGILAAVMQALNPARERA